MNIAKKLDRLDITDAAKWNDRGEEHYKSKDYALARECYVLALQLNPKHINALYSLGWLSEHGQGVDKDIAEAKRYYGKAAAEGDYDSHKRFFLLEHPEFTASQWNDVGESYYKVQDYLRARICYEKTHELDPTVHNASYSLGILFHAGRGVDQNLATARSYYEKASQAGSYYAKYELLKLDHSHITDAAEWNALGEEYYNGKDYARARACYELAWKLNPKHINVLYSLGWLYEHGQGVDKDIAKAREYYEKAAAEGHYNSKKQLFLLNNPNVNTAFQWHILGEKYYWGRDNKPQDYLTARMCYEKAFALDSKDAVSAYRMNMLRMLKGIWPKPKPTTNKQQRKDYIGQNLLF